jgi:hypothetical protein
VTIANAGHLAPYCQGAEIPVTTGLPLGIHPDADYQETQFTLSAGQSLTFLSDGVVEARNASGELFGFDRTLAISDSGAEAIAQVAVAFGQDDDITVLTLKREAAAIPSPIPAHAVVLSSVGMPAKAQNGHGEVDPVVELIGKEVGGNPHRRPPSRGSLQWGPRIFPRRAESRGERKATIVAHANKDCCGIRATHGRHWKEHP